jgi:hypothetical protein
MRRPENGEEQHIWLSSFKKRDCGGSLPTPTAPAQISQNLKCLKPPGCLPGCASQIGPLTVGSTAFQGPRLLKLINTNKKRVLLQGAARAEGVEYNHQ